MRHINWHIVFAFIIFISFSYLSCLNPFAPKLQESLDLSQLITEQKSPDEVLTNFKYAYTFKDSSLYADLLDSSFVFLYFDPNYGSSGRFVSWGRDVDLLTTGRLFRNFTVIDLIWHSTIYSFEEENFSEMSKSFQLSLVNDQESINISGNAIFSFVKNEKDEKWRIVRWKDESDL
ncbi:hypothetical protein GF337_08115 [candidate division KSB1 bacterium]|nr:hypothetical protein [candidate division KSB1 bacterium]